MNHLHEDISQTEYESFGTNLPAVREDDALQSPPRLSGRVRDAIGRLPRITDPQQRKAGGKVLRILALLLVLTLVARGTAGATVPKVTVQRPQQGEIVQKVSGSGTVRVSGTQSIHVPEGLVLEEVLVSAGEQVKAGDALARFDTQRLQEELERQAAALKGLTVKRDQLLRQSAGDPTTLQTAERNLARAQQDYDNAVASTGTAVANAQNALTQAENAANDAHSRLAAIEDTESEEYQLAWEDWNTKSTDANEKRDALASARQEADAELLRLNRAVEDAATSLASTQRSEAEAQKDAAETAAKNRVEAETLALDITAQEKQVDSLQALVQAGGILYAESGGTVRSGPATGDKTDDGPLLQLSDAAGGFEAEMWVDKKDAEKLAPGDKCDVAASGGSGYYRATSEGVVKTVSAAGDDGKSRVTVRLAGGEWKEGDTVDVQMVQDSQRHSLCVPLSALHAASDGYYVLVLEDKSTVLGQEKQAVKIPVTVKAQDSTNAAIEGPVGEKDDIIVSANKMVQPGDKVRVAA